MRTRRVWNEHTYHITNIGEDGQVPSIELPNWTQPGLNDYRQNRLRRSRELPRVCSPEMVHLG